MDTLLIYALGMPAGGKGGSQGNPIIAFLPLILMFFIFYFLLIRPQQKKQKEHQKMLSQLKKGEHIISSGGIHGIISSVKDDIVSVKIADNVKIDLSKSCISTIKDKSQTQN